MTARRPATRSQRMADFRAAQERVAAIRHHPPAPAEPEGLALFDLTAFPESKEHHHEHD